MNCRTDLAIEAEKAEYNTEKIGQTKLHFLEEKGKKFYTLEFLSVEKLVDFSDVESALSIALKNLLPEKSEKTLIVGLGNNEITSDSIGPSVAEKILATRHITGEFAKNIGLENLKSVAVIAPNVLGKTGIEVCELLKGTVDIICPDVVIVIDALCAKSTERLFSCIQLTNKGISPGSGVKNSRKEISEESLGVPVVAIGVPTVVDANTIAFELTEKEPQSQTELIVTPKDVDFLCQKTAEFLSETLNVLLQPEIERDIILSLV